MAKTKKSKRRYVIVDNVPSQEADMILADIMFQIGVYSSEFDLRRANISIEEGWSYPGTKGAKRTFVLYDENRLSMFEYRMSHDLPCVSYTITDDPSGFDDHKAGRSMGTFLCGGCYIREPVEKETEK